MKKYLQISTVLAIFFLLVFLKSLHKDEDGNIVVQRKNPNVIPTSAPTAVPSDTPTDTPPAPVTHTTVTQSPTPTAKPSPTPSGQYKDGSYTGSVEDAFYGYVQVQAIVSGGKLSDIQFLQYPNDNSTSLRINSQALPILKSEAIAAQSAQVDVVSGASDSSPAFAQSLANALNQAKR